MKAMILAAGKGERMRPLTLTTPKPLLQAGGRPLIAYHLDQLRRAGFEDIVINHSWLGQKIEDYLGDGHSFGVAITYSREPQPLETAGGIRQALPLLTQNTNDWFVVVNGDTWTDFDFNRLKPPAGNHKALLVLVDNPEHNPNGDFHLGPQGDVDPTGPNRKTFAGISVLHRSLFEELSPGYHRLAPVLIEAMAQGEVIGLLHDGDWLDVGSPERLADLDRRLGLAEST
ncbi:MAG: nucleotidyltransferase family protein [Oleiphilaceae bacterium]|nr:nucleotidyltransferase family protein [Oleiphilaceae bacterium]